MMLLKRMCIIQIKKGLDKKIEYVVKNPQDVSKLDTYSVLVTKNEEVKNKTSDANKLVSNSALNKKI